jgi:integrase
MACFSHTLHHGWWLRGVDVVPVRDLLGHPTIVTTMRYAHSNDTAKRLAVNALDSVKVVTGPKKAA